MSMLCIVILWILVLLLQRLKVYLFLFFAMFMISNGGVFGSLMGTPIINPPQSAILGMHGIFDRPVAINGKVEVRPMMYVALTYDHRLIDGREGVTFLRKIKQNVEDPKRMLLNV